MVSQTVYKPHCFPTPRKWISVVRFSCAFVFIPLYVFNCLFISYVNTILTSLRLSKTSQTTRSSTVLFSHRLYFLTRCLVIHVWKEKEQYENKSRIWFLVVMRFRFWIVMRYFPSSVLIRFFFKLWWTICWVITRGGSGIANVFLPRTMVLCSYSNLAHFPLAIRALGANQVFTTIVSYWIVIHHLEENPHPLSS